jgi:chromosomal replication initiation ATPase DnaA
VARATTHGRGFEQLPLELGHDPAQTRDDLIISDPLAQAVALIDGWPNWSVPVVILCGPGGSGKSHLAAIWRARSDALRVSATAAADMAALERAQAHLLIEDIDRDGFDDTALFHLINMVLEHRRTMLITTRLWPAAWTVSLPDLRSRLKAAMLVEIGEPDDALLGQVITKLFADRQIVVDPKVVAYLVARMERSFDSAQRLVADLDRLALSRRARISTALASEALARMSGGSAAPD